MRADAERWDAKYARRTAKSGIRPDALVYKHLQRLRAHSRSRAGGRALDLACGRGHNAILGAMCGYRTTGVDISRNALEQASATAAWLGLHIDWLGHDLDDHVLPAAAYDAVFVFHFLNRKLLPSIAASLRPGGLLFYKTFNRTHLDAHPNFPPDFVLDDGELGSSFEALSVIDCGEPKGGTGRALSPTSYLVANAPDID